MKKSSKKVVKGWAQIADDGSRILVLKIDYPYAVFPSKEIAVLHDMHNNYRTRKIVEVTITFTPPKKK